MNAIIGSWGSKFSTTIMGIHQVVLEDGRVLYWGDGAEGDAFSGTQKYGIFNPLDGSHEILDANHSVKMFCGAGLVLPGTDKVLIAGGNGDGEPGAQLFDLSDMELVKDSANDMDKGRFYPTMLSLSSGQAVVLGGKGTDGIPEIFTLGEGWRELTGAKSDDVATDWWYPKAWVNKDGEIIYFAINAGNQDGNIAPIGTMEIMALDPSGNGSLRQIGELPMDMDVTSPAAMYDIGKIVMMDGAGDLWIMDINGDEPRFTFAADLPTNRDNSDMTVLPDGRVLINGGTVVGNSQSEDDAIFESTIFDPYTGKVSVVDAESAMRLYHSSSALLPDGTVLSMGGGGLYGLENFWDAQIYSPDYLFNADGSLADRPEITAAPNSLIPGQTFTVTVDETNQISRLSFVKTGAVTHSMNMESGRMDLDFKVLSTTELEVTIPANANVVTAGNWMLFALNDQGTPSTAALMSVEPTIELYQATVIGDAPLGDGEILVEYFDIENDTTSLDQIDFDATPISSETLTSINENAPEGSFYSGGPSDFFAAKYTSVFSIEKSGTYTFFLKSDDASRLTINGKQLIDSNELQTTTEKSASIYLKAGTHSLEGLYFEAAENAVMELAWSGPNFEKSLFQLNGNKLSEPMDKKPELLEQLVENGDFRDGTLDGWDVLNPNEILPPTITQKSLSLNALSQTTYGEGVAQNIKTEIGATYEASFIARQFGGGDGEHTVRIQVLDLAGELLSEEDIEVSRNEVKSFKGSFVAPSDEIRLIVTNPTSTSSYGTDVLVDNISLVKTAEPGTTPPNIDPVASDDIVDVVLRSDEVVGDNVAFLLENDTDADDDTLEVISVSAKSAQGADILLEDRDNDGSFEWIGYDPLSSTALQNLASGERVSDSLTYTISDGNGGTSTASIQLTIEGQSVSKTAPVATDDVVNVLLPSNKANGDNVAFLLANDTDPNADQISISSVEAFSARGAAISLSDTDGDGSFDFISYDPTVSAELSAVESGRTIDDQVIYTITDNKGGFDSATIELTVIGIDTPILDAPVINSEPIDDILL